MDLCHRIKRNGYKIRFLSDCNIIHFGGKSSDFDKYFSRKKNLESRHKYMKKYFGAFGNYFSVFVELFFDRPLDFILRGIKRSNA
jgi:GT2 family glycosyltransferase